MNYRGVKKTDSAICYDVENNTVVATKDSDKSTTCRRKLSTGVFFPTGYRERTRTVVRHSNDPDQPCPHLTEYQTCEYSLCYRWKTTPTGPCRLKYPDMQCGEGMRNRTVECVSAVGVRRCVSLLTYLFHELTLFFCLRPVTPVSAVLSL